jgi:hypothetical protein
MVRFKEKEPVESFSNPVGTLYRFLIDAVPSAIKSFTERSQR